MVKPETPRGRASSPYESLANLGVIFILRLHRLAGTWTTKGDFLNERYI